MHSLCHSFTHFHQVLWTLVDGYTSQTSVLLIFLLVIPIYVCKSEKASPTDNMADRSSASSPGVFEMEEKLSKSRFIPKTYIICVSVNLLVSIVILVLAIVLITAKEDHENASSYYKPVRTGASSGKQAVLDRFPGYFRTPEQQKIIAERLNFTKPAKIGDKNQTNTCNVVCPKNSSVPIIPLEPTFSTYHGCCFSEPTYVSPTVKKDITGVVRVLAQFDGNRQYFKQEECMQVPGCTGCLCQIQEALYTGIYVNTTGENTEYGTAMFNFNSCCKCVNT